MDWTQPFLIALRELGKLAPAARAIGIEPSTVYARRKNDVDFAAAVDEAISDCHDGLEAEMVRRARDGVNEPVIHQGALQYLMEPVLDDEGAAVLDDKGRVRMRPVLDAEGNFVPLTVSKKSDSLLMFALKGYRKGTFAERTELTGADGKPLAPEVDETTRIARVAAILEAARARRDAEDIG